MNLLDKLNPKLRTSIELIMNICSELHIQAYAVGGCVRDAILGKEINDIDICIEADTILLLPYLKKIAKCKYHEEFQTSSIVFSNGISIDLIRCRKETYKYNGSLPTIIPSNIYDDLNRRDFTVNSLAYDLTKLKLLDYFGGMDDIKNKVIKKIHKESYAEDPTRILRAVKYAVRYNFKLYDRKEIFINLKGGCMSTISRDRIIKEILLICSEQDWKDCFILCSQLGIFDLHINVLGEDNEMLCFENIEDRLQNIFFSITNSKFKGYFVDNSLINIHIRNGFNQYILEEKQIIDKLDAADSNYEIFLLLRKMNPNEKALLCYNHKIKYKIINYETRLSKVKLEVDGKYIRQLGINEGVLIGNILSYLYKIKLCTGMQDDVKYLTENLGEILNVCEY